MERDVTLFVNFLRLVKKYFRKEQDIRFYANKLEVAPEELSRIIWETSDSDLKEWIELMEQNRSNHYNYQKALYTPNNVS